MLKYVEQSVLPKRQAAAAKGEGGNDEVRSHHKQFLGKWWQLSYRRTDMLNALKGLSRYIACSRVTSRPIFFLIHSSVRPGDALQVFAFDDDYSFGVLHSSLHIAWFMGKRSNMKSDPRYSSDGIFGTFPWPQAPKPKDVRAVAEAARRLYAVRAEALKGVRGGLRALYETLDLPGANPLQDAHDALDDAVLAAYGFSADGDLLQQLRDLNLETAARIASGAPVVGPGIPADYATPSELKSSDCIGSPGK